jgi:tetratricopeptide (TPR) repeat protein
MKQFKSALLLLPLTSLLCFCSQSESSKGDAHFKKGEYEKAEESYSETLKLDPKDVRMLYNRGRAREEQGDFELAKADYEKALISDPNNFQVLLSLANLHFEQKNFNNSLLYSSKAVEIPGAPAMASFHKARALQQLGLSEDALKAYGNAIKLDKDFGQAYLNRGFLKLALKKNKGACEDFKLASLLEYSGAEEALKKHCK